MPDWARSAPAWPHLLSAAAAKDFNGAVETVVRTFATHSLTEAPQSLTEAPQHWLDVQGLAQAIANALQAQEPRQVLVGCIALLAALDSSLSPEDVAALANDAVFTGLSTVLTSGSPLLVGAAARGVCALIAAASPGTKQEKKSSSDSGIQHSSLAARPRKVVQQLRSVMEAHPKALLVQQALARGCCAVLNSEQPALGTHAGTLWTLLWPLAVHPKPEVAEAAVLCLCRLTWLAKPLNASSSANATDAAVLDAEAAIGAACDEFTKVWKMMEPSLKSETDIAAPMALLQCTRLLGLMRSLVLCGRSVMQITGRAASRGEAAAGEEEVIVVLPISRLVASLDMAFATLFDGTRMMKSISTAPAQAGTVNILSSCLELATALADASSTALLPHAARFRRWIDLMSEAHLEVYEQHASLISELVLALERNVPAVLLNANLLRRLVARLLAVLQAAERCCPNQRPALQIGPTRRKRKAAEIEVSSNGTSGRHMVTQQAKRINSQHRIHSARAACVMLARLLHLAAPLLAATQVASICEQLVRILWLGAMASVSTGTKSNMLGSGSSGTLGTSSNEYTVDLEAAAGCRLLCRDAPTALALIDVVEALHQKPKVGIVPLAPSLVNAFVALLDAVATEFQARALRGKRIVGCGIKAALPRSEDSAASASVRLRALEVRSSLLSFARVSSPSAGCADPGATLPGISISWPAPLLQATPPAAEPAVESAGELAAEELAGPEDFVQPPAEEEPAAAISKSELDSPADVPELPAEAPATKPAEPVADSAPPSGGQQPDVQNAFDLQPLHEAKELSVTASSSGLPQLQGGAAVADLEVSKAASAVETPSSNGDGAESSKLAMPVVDSSVAFQAASAAEDNLPPMDLFPDDGDGENSPIPELCMDSPDSEDAAILP